MKQVFTTSQVLTSTQMNNLQANDYNWTTSAQTSSYVLVAANAGQTVTMTNAGATTITVNTGLFTAGDTVRILNLGVGTCTITAGTATVNTAGSLVLPQYACGTLWFSSASAAIFIPDDRGSGLTLIKTQTIGSAVSSVTVSDVFSATYDAYKIIVTGGSASGNVGLRLALGATTSGYYQGGYGNSYVGAANTAEINNGASFAVGNGSAGALFVNCEIFSPFAADETTISGLFAAAQTSGAYISFAGYLNTTTSYTSFTFSPLTGTITGGTIRVYGYQNS